MLPFKEQMYWKCFELGFVHYLYFTVSNVINLLLLSRYAKDGYCSNLLITTHKQLCYLDSLRYSFSKEDLKSNANKYNYNEAVANYKIGDLVVDKRSKVIKGGTFDKVFIEVMLALRYWAPYLHSYDVVFAFHDHITRSKESLEQECSISKGSNSIIATNQYYSNPFSINYLNQLYDIFGDDFNGLHQFSYVCYWLSLFYYFELCASSRIYEQLGGPKAQYFDPVLLVLIYNEINRFLDSGFKEVQSIGRFSLDNINKEKVTGLMCCQDSDKREFPFNRIIFDLETVAITMFGRIEKDRTSYTKIATFIGPELENLQVVSMMLEDILKEF